MHSPDAFVGWACAMKRSIACARPPHGSPPPSWPQAVTGKRCKRPPRKRRYSSSPSTPCDPTISARTDTRTRRRLRSTRSARTPSSFSRHSVNALRRSWPTPRCSPGSSLPTHGVRDNLGYVLKSEIPTLATILAENGYVTGAAVSTYVLRRATNVGKGFAFYDDALDYASTAVKSHAERDGDRSRQALERWIQETRNRRIFGFLHLYEPHAPYLPPPEFRTHRDPYDDEIGYADTIVGRFLATLRSSRLVRRCADHHHVRSRRRAGRSR